MTLPRLPRLPRLPKVLKSLKSLKSLRGALGLWVSMAKPLFSGLLIGVLWLGGCAGTRESVSEAVERTRVRVLFDPSAGKDATKCSVRFTALPRGLRTAVCFGWDVEGAEALELAGLLEQYGWRGTLFFPYRLEGEEGAAVADGILEVEARGVEVGCRTLVEQTADIVRYAAEGKAFWDAFVGRPVVSFGAVGAEAWKDLDRLAGIGYLSVRSDNRVIVLGSSEKERPVMVYRSFSDHREENQRPATKTQRHKENPEDGEGRLRVLVSSWREDIAKRWTEVREQEGGMLYVGGRWRDSGADERPWEELESLLAEYGRMEDVWYCTQGEWAAYVSTRDTSHIVRLQGEENELRLGIEAGRSVPRTWRPALTVEVRAHPSWVVMVLVEDQPVPFEARGERVLFNVETIR